MRRRPSDETRIHVLSPRAAPPEGLSTIPTDLASFFVTVRRVGRDPGLLLLTLRALRQRAGFGGTRMRDLGWILWASEGRISGWLHTLTRAGLIVSQPSLAYDLDVLVLEFVSEPPNPAVWPVEGPISGAAHHEIPTHWFVQVLPRIGRTTFLVYLYLLSREADTKAPSAIGLSHLADTLALRGPLHARLHLGRLKRHGLLRAQPSGHGLIVADPPPLTRMQRLLLKAREVAPIPRSALGLAALALLLAVPVLLLAYLLTHPLP